MSSKSEAYQKISELVERFKEQHESYTNSLYNETLTRRDFIDPFFKSLGWDVDNANGYAEAYREVIHEDRVKIGDNLKAPDYSFRLSGGKRLFFVEAKKPSIAIKNDILPAYQVRRYGWSAKLALSIITDFEEFAIYDCTKKPNLNDKASTARIKYLTFTDYLHEFDFLWDTFSKEKVLKGSFDKFNQNNAQKRGTTTVDKEFLESLDSWRTYLATNISWNNKELDEDEINFAVQQTIDRLIFLRIAEDRDIEQYGDLRECIKQGNYYYNLVRKFQRADEKYNSGLFDFHKDKISKILVIENKVLKTIINELYYPACPYEFSVISVEILGNAYEQFLGKQIKIDKTHRAKIVEKTEIRKAGGVYYTPEYIVDFIVQNTLGKLIDGKTPKEVSQIKIADPACGSGSFLIGAYKYLLAWHKFFYTNSDNQSKGRKENPLTPEGNLTTTEKKRILINNIFGVDIDLNAVEVTKLSLLLTCMEGETESSIAQLNLFNERVLPSLDDNIKSGNSLIDTDYYDKQLDFGEEKKIRPFNWKKEFFDIFKNGGFDVIIGNPPYHSVKEMVESQKQYFYENYITGEGRFNLFSLFIERARSLLSENGLLGFIIPNSFLANSQYENFRKFLLEIYSIKYLVNFDGGVFKDANVETLISIFQKETNKKKRHTNQINIIYDIESGQNIKGKKIQKEQIEFINSDGNIFEIKKSFKIEWKLFYKLSDLCDIRNGINPGNIADKVITNEIVSIHCKKLIDGKDIKLYGPIRWRNLYVIYDEKYVNKLRNDLSKKGISWTARIIKTENYFEQEKLVIQRIRNLSLKRRLVLAYDSDNYYTSINIGVIIKKAESPYDIKYILGLLNSSFMNHFYQGRFHNIQIKNEFLSELPIPKIDLNDSSSIIIYQSIIDNVNTIIELNKDILRHKLESKVNLIQRHIESCVDKINKLVYKLYNVSQAEIEIIEHNLDNNNND